MRPESTRALLMNLKRTKEEGWLLKPAFINETTLRKLFAADWMTWDTEYAKSRTKILAPVAANLRSPLIPGASIKVILQCDLISTAAPDGHIGVVQEMRGFIRITADRLPNIDLTAVRAVFGMEPENFTDYSPAFDMPPPPIPPTYKGWVNYPDVVGTKREGQKLGVRFFFAIGGRVPDARGPAVDPNDFVQSIWIDAGQTSPVAEGPK